ncbi:AsmA family protein [Ramlibacter terrae]|uniref:AsmA family protein n=1 Tax=Ramlibacter terrae TaxID=2732511 RepID=A0ABX6P6U8_9BURK|nr:AsmA family protein [Ramlibacter terrae]
MNHPLQTFRGTSRLTKVLISIGAVLVLLALLLIFFPWDLLRGPLNRYVSEETGRKFEITRRLDVKLGRTTRVFADGIEFANPAWAADPFLLKADSAELHIRLWPLLKKQVELPFLGLRGAQLGLQMEADGRRTRALDKNSSDEGSVPSIGRMQVDGGSLHFVSAPQQADIRADFTLKEGSGEAMPLSYRAKGSWRKQPFTAEGRTGSVLQIGSKAEAQQDPFPLEIRAAAGRTRFDATGTIGNLAQLDGIDAKVDLRGVTLAELHQLLGVVLPGTPPYALKGQLRKQGDTWSVKQMQGELGESDLSGELTYQKGEKVPRLTGKVESKRLDFNDLGPLIGLQTDKQKAGVDATPPEVLAANRKMRRTGDEKLLPVKKLDFSKFKDMDADVWYSAASVRACMQALPVTQLKVHVQLASGAMKLDPLEMGVAGGRATGRIHVNSASTPATALIQLDGRSLQINQLFPSVQRLQASFGSLNAKVDLQGRGDSIAALLGSSSGSMGLLTGRGQFSNILLEFLGLDGGEVIRLFVRGDKQVQLRCAAAAFEVKQGVLETKTLLLDTSDTVVHGDGRASFATEGIDLVLRPEPKDVSILSVRTPLHIGGTFAQPKVRPEGGSPAARGVLALGLAAINPLLALAATIETGPGQDADCAQSFKEASAVAKTGSPTKAAPASTAAR